MSRDHTFLLYLPVYRCRYFGEHGLSVPWPDVNLPHDWHLNPDRVPVTVVLVSDRARLAEIRLRRAQLPAELRRNPTYVVDSSNWDVWFATEHEEHRRSSFAHAQGHAPAPPSPLVVVKEEDAYIAALEEAEKRTIEDSENDELDKWLGLAQVLAEYVARMQANAPPPPPAPPAQTWSWTSTLPCGWARPTRKPSGRQSSSRRRRRCASTRCSSRSTRRHRRRSQMQRNRQRHW